jgi:hypothetical protein
VRHFTDYAARRSLRHRSISHPPGAFVIFTRTLHGDTGSNRV